MNFLKTLRPKQQKGLGLRFIFSLIWGHMKLYPGKTAGLLGSVVAVATLWTIEPLYSSHAIDTLLTIQQGASVNLIRIFGIWALLFVALSLTQAIEKYLGWEMDNFLVVHRRRNVYEHVLDLDIAFHTSQKSGEVIKQLDEGADHLIELQRNFVMELFPSFLSAIAFLVLSFWIQPILAGILVGSIILYVSIVVFGTIKTSKLQYEVNKLWVEAIGRAYDAVGNIFAVKSGAQEREEVRRLEKLDGQALAKQQQVNYRWASVESINFFMATRIMIVGIGILLYVKGGLTLGQLYFFQFSFFRVLTPFEVLGNILPQWNRRVGKVRMAEAILQTPVIIGATPGRTISNLRGEIVLDHICFSYHPAISILGTTDVEASATTPPPPHDAEQEEAVTTTHTIDATEQDMIRAPHAPAVNEKELHAREVLHDVSMTIRSGEHVALVGHSGAGKSTLAMLLNRFYDVSAGRILIDGVDMRDLDPKWFRGQIGLVFQENVTFNDTILENIRYARPDASREEVMEAARNAAADEFIGALPEGYDTLVGDRGIKLSGGQRQRVAIARAILKDPRIVILDEATSALDSVTERAVQQGIKELIANRTAVIIAHRLSTVRSVDRIAVLDEGKLIAIARHEELLKTSPIYKEMVELQSHGMLAE